MARRDKVWSLKVSVFIGIPRRRCSGRRFPPCSATPSRTVPHVLNALSPEKVSDNGHFFGNLPAAHDPRMTAGDARAHKSEFPRARDPR
jgi:hypothetical protein